MWNIKKSLRLVKRAHCLHTILNAHILTYSVYPHHAHVLVELLLVCVLGVFLVKGLQYHISILANVLSHFIF